jgi:hypothetical protein
MYNPPSWNDHSVSGTRQWYFMEKSITLWIWENNKDYKTFLLHRKNVFLWYQQISGNIDFSLKPVSGRLLFNANSAIFQIPVYNDENKLIFNEMMMNSALYKSNTLIWIFIVLAHWHNSPRIDMSPHSDTLSWFRAVESCYFSLVLRAWRRSNT